MPKFNFKSLLNNRLNNGIVQIDVGPRSSSSRLVRQFAAAVIMSAAFLTAAIPSTAHASWLSQTLTGNRVDSSNVQNVQSVSVGVVRMVRQVELSNDNMNAGNVIGAVGGGLLGHLIGGGRGKILMTVVGAIGGGKIGGNIERNHQHNPGYQIVVDIVNSAGGSYSPGQQILITQSANGVHFYPNDVVYVTSPSYGPNGQMIPPRIMSVQSNENISTTRPAEYSNGGNGVAPASQSVNEQYAHPTTSVNKNYRP